LGSAHLYMYPLCQYLNRKVDDFEVSDGLWLAHQRSQRVEEWLKDDPQQLGEGVIEQTTFQLSGKIHVHLIISLVLVMLLATNPR